jgi:hypothetical protein
MVEFNGSMAIFTFEDGRKWVIDLNLLSKILREDDECVQTNRNHSLS